MEEKKKTDWEFIILTINFFLSLIALGFSTYLLIQQ